MNKNKIIDIAKLAFFIALFIFGVGYVLANYADPTSGPPVGGSTYNADTPINISTLPQIKEGPLTLYGTLWLQGINSRFYVDSQVGLGSAFKGGGSGATKTISNDPNVKLDIDGQIQIRNSGDNQPSLGKVLTAVDNNGLATWKTLAGGISSLLAGTGITFNQNPALTPKTSSITGGSSYVSVFSPETQRRISTCGTNQGIQSVAESGVSDCKPLVTQVTAGGGLTATGGGSGTSGGPVNVTLNLALNSGLVVNGSNQLGLNVDQTGNRGLKINSSNQLVLRDDCTSNNPFLKWDGANWSCAPNPAPLAVPGSSVMYLKNITAAPSCPSTPAPGWSSLSSYQENVGGGVTNFVRACYRTDKTCQVLRLVSTTAASLATCPASPWLTSAGLSTCGAGSLNCGQEYAPGGGSTYNYVRNCYVCY